MVPERAQAERGDEGDKITATCEAGYELGGTARWTCTQGAWSGGSRCTAVQCSGPPEEHTQSCDSDSFPTGQRAEPRSALRLHPSVLYSFHWRAAGNRFVHGAMRSWLRPCQW